MLLIQEWSQRYAETSQADVPQFRRQDSHNRQNSFDDLTDEMQYMLEDLTDKHFKSGHDLYKQMLSVTRELPDVCFQCARPPGCT